MSASQTLYFGERIRSNEPREAEEIQAVVLSHNQGMIGIKLAEQVSSKD